MGDSNNLIEQLSYRKKKISATIPNIETKLKITDALDKQEHEFRIECRVKYVTELQHDNNTKPFLDISFSDNTTNPKTTSNDSAPSNPAFFSNLEKNWADLMVKQLFTVSENVTSIMNLMTRFNTDCMLQLDSYQNFHVDLTFVRKANDQIYVLI